MAETVDVTAVTIPETVEGILEAPVIYFELVTGINVGDGIGRIGLDIMVTEPAGPGLPQITRRKAVAHLRGSEVAYDNLINALMTMKMMLAAPPSGEKPN